MLEWAIDHDDEVKKIVEQSTRYTTCGLAKRLGTSTNKSQPIWPSTIHINLHRRCGLVYPKKSKRSRSMVWCNDDDIYFSLQRSLPLSHHHS
mmetsp:Transcript_723/g.1322  ORF Transcript_723/g.1322 Transcript_723/m.1322 type:complete len:92 (-) Transcript_723:1079-1354(-)